MLTTQTTFNLGTVLLLTGVGLPSVLLMTGVALPPTVHAPSYYTARLSGAVANIMSGSAEFGRPQGQNGDRPFVITLGAHGEQGAVVFTKWDGLRPGPGKYRISPEPSGDGIQALVVTGTPEHPTGVFRGRRGTLTITSSDQQRITGRFSMDAEGYLASDPENEDRALVIEGELEAVASRSQKG